MALDTFIAGAYTGTYNAVDVGVTEQGYELQQESHAQEIGPSDAYGESVIDLVYRGGRVHLQFESKAYKAGSTTPFWPWGSLGVMGVVGRLGSNVAAAQVLTATASTPAAASPASLTATLSILAPNNPARLLFSSVLRTVPVRLLCLPFSSGGIKWFTTT
jgi:hypothetical protein